MNLLHTDLIRRINNGDSISDLELTDAIKFYRNMAEGLWVLGPYFHLSWRAVNEVHVRLESFKEARKRNGTKYP